MYLWTTSWPFHIDKFGTWFSLKAPCPCCPFEIDSMDWSVHSFGVMTSWSAPEMPRSFTAAEPDAEAEELVSAARTLLAEAAPLGKDEEEEGSARCCRPDCEEAL